MKAFYNAPSQLLHNRYTAAVDKLGSDETLWVANRWQLIPPMRVSRRYWLPFIRRGAHTLRTYSFAGSKKSLRILFLFEGCCMHLPLV